MSEALSLSDNLTLRNVSKILYDENFVANNQVLSFSIDHLYQPWWPNDRTNIKRKITRLVNVRLIFRRVKRHDVIFDVRHWIAQLILLKRLFRIRNGQIFRGWAKEKKSTGTRVLIIANTSENPSIPLVSFLFLYLSVNVRRFARTRTLIFSSFPRWTDREWLEIEVCALLLPINGKFDSTFWRDLVLARFRADRLFLVYTKVSKRPIDAVVVSAMQLRGQFVLLFRLVTTNLLQNSLLLLFK